MVSAPARPTVLLLGSLAATRTMWQWQQPAWSRHFDLIAWDYHGHGNDRDAASMQAVGSIAATVLADLDSQGVEHFHVVGVSLGGMVALELAHQAPQRVQRVVASHCRYFQTPATAAAWDERIALVLHSGMAALEDATIERWIGAPAGEDFAQKAALIRRMLQSVAPASYAACASAVRDFDARPWVGSLATPALLVAGEADAAAPAAHVEELAGHIAGARCTQIAQGHHVPTLDTPDLYTRLVEDFLRG